MRLEEANRRFNQLSGTRFKDLFSPSDMQMIIINKGKTGQLLELSLGMHYVPVSETANFTDYTKDGFTLEDHKRLAALFRRLDSLGVKLLLSNHDVPLVHELYEGYQIESVDVRRGINSVASKRTGKEVIVTNY